MKRSRGSWLGGSSGLLIMLAFFLPWLRACGNEMSGYDLANNSNGMVEDPWVYWLTLAVGVLLVLLFILVRTEDTGRRIGLGTLRLALALIGFLPLLNVWYQVQERSTLELLYGGWLTALGYAGAALSFFIDLGRSRQQEWSAPPAQGYSDYDY